MLATIPPYLFDVMAQVNPEKLAIYIRSFQFSMKAFISFSHIIVYFAVEFLLVYSLSLFTYMAFLQKEKKMPVVEERESQFKFVIVLRNNFTT